MEKEVYVGVRKNGYEEKEGYEKKKRRGRGCQGVICRRCWGEAILNSMITHSSEKRKRLTK